MDCTECTGGLGGRWYGLHRKDRGGPNTETGRAARS